MTPPSRKATIEQAAQAYAAVPSATVLIHRADRLNRSTTCVR